MKPKSILLSFAMILFATLAHAQQAPVKFRDPASQFVNPTQYNSYAGAVSLATADFNGDGKPDIAAAGGYYGRNKIAIFLNNGDGTLTQSSVLDVTGAGSVFAADVNGDGRPDLIVTDFSSTTIQVVLGKGDGKFEAPASYSITVSSPILVVVGDVNGDGHPDLLVQGGQQVSLLLNNGNGTFGKATTLPITVGGQFAAGDFNHDGNLDLAVTNGSQTSGAVSVYLGNGNGTFQSPVSYMTGNSPIYIQIADMNHDGNLDLVISDFGAFPTNGDIAILLGNGDGTFQAASFYAAANNPNTLTLGDFGGDGNVSVAVIDGSVIDSGNVFLLFGNSDGTLQPISSGYALGAITILGVDLNSDGKADLVSGRGSGTFPGNLAVVYNAGNHLFNAPANYYPAGYPASSDVADFNGDGNLDIVTVGTNLATQQGMITIMLGRGDGTFPLSMSHSFGAGGNSPYQVNAIDLNGDGKPDLVVSQYHGAIRSLVNNGNGTFTAKGVFGANLFGLFTVADFNGDGIPDIAALNIGGTAVQIFFGNGDGSFRSGPLSTVPTPATGIHSGDLNRDGKADLVFDIPFSAGAAVELGNGDGTFTQSGFYPVKDYFPTTLVADFNGDGIPDIGYSGAPAYCDALIPNDVGYLPGNGDGTFGPIHNFVDTFNCGSFMIVGDFNGDGILDMALYGGGIGLMLGNGTGFESMEGYIAGNSGGSVVGDFNNDGALDLATQNSEAITILLNASGVRNALTSSPNPSTSGQSVTFTATATPSSAFQSVPSGSITFRDGNQVLGTIKLSSGQATFTTSALTVGKHVITATYSGDSNFVSGYAASVVQTVN